MSIVRCKDISIFGYFDVSLCRYMGQVCFSTESKIDNRTTIKRKYQNYTTLVSKHRQNSAIK